MSIKKIEQKLEKDLLEMFESEQFKSKMSELKEVEADSEYKFKVVVTTEGVDRDGEVLKADGIDFKNYMKNPVVLVDHNYRIDSIVGKTLKIYQENGKTIAEGVFAKGVEKAELIRNLYNQGFVKTVSIGFIVKNRDENNRDTITKSEMLEFSFVAVPANPEALSLDGKTYQKCLDLGIIKEEKQEEEQEEKSKIDLKDIFNIVKEMRDEISEMKSQIKTFADDKVKEQDLEKSRLVGQDLAKSLSAFLAEAKKSKS